MAIIATVDSVGSARQMFGLHADCVPMWLGTINANKVSEEARPVLIAYQREAARALRDYFYRGVAVQPSSMNEFDVLRAAIDQIESAQRTATEAKEIAQRTDARLDAMKVATTGSPRWATPRSTAWTPARSSCPGLVSVPPRPQWPSGGWAPSRHPTTTTPTPTASAECRQLSEVPVILAVNRPST